MADLGIQVVQVAPGMKVGPNPFRGSLVIHIEGMEIGTECNLAVYDLQGRRVGEWTEVVESMQTEVTWDGRDRSGQPIPAGVYFLRASVPGKDYTVKLVRLAN